MCLGVIEKVGEKYFWQEIFLSNFGNDLPKVVQAGQPRELCTLIDILRSLNHFKQNALNNM